MDFRERVFDYCERTSAGFWAEPLNALSNGAFLIAAAAAFAALRGLREKDTPALALIGVTAAVGLGSFVFHTIATRGAMLLDVIPIAVFIYGYFLLALRRFFGASLPLAVAITVAFATTSALIEGRVSGLNGSIAYLPALAALIAFAALLWRDPARRHIARGLGGAAAVFLVSLTFRTVDRDLCRLVPSGTHFIWHALNACTLWLLLRTAILSKR